MRPTGSNRARMRATAIGDRGSTAMTTFGAAITGRPERLGSVDAVRRRDGRMHIGRCTLSGHGGVWRCGAAHD